MMGLRDEIASGPLAAELADALAVGDDASIVTVLNEPRYDVYGRVARAEFAMWCGASGLRAVIEDHAAMQASPLRSIALTILDFLRGGVAESIDFGLADNEQMLGAWVTAGGITQPQADALLGMSLHRISRAEQIGLIVTLETVARSKS